MKTLHFACLATVFSGMLAACDSGSEFKGRDATGGGGKSAERSGKNAQDDEPTRSLLEDKAEDLPGDEQSMANASQGAAGSDAAGDPSDGSNQAAPGDGKSGGSGDANDGSDKGGAGDGMISGLTDDSEGGVGGNAASEGTDAADKADGGLGDPEKPEISGNNPGQAAGMDDEMRKSLQACLKNWGIFHPFRHDRQVPDRIIFGHLELGPANRVVDAIFNTELSGITDTKVTDKPALIMISASINVLATDFVLPTVAYRFLNPKGWYCMHLEVDVGSHIRVDLKKGANLADPHFAFGILADTAPIAEHNVSILSKSEINVVP